METINLNLDLWKTPNFPPLNILESRTETTLQAFNKCRILDIKLRTNDKKIENFSRLFNSLTERRAVESLRLSLYICYIYRITFKGRYNHWSNSRNFIVFIEYSTR